MEVIDEDKVNVLIDSLFHPGIFDKIIKQLSEIPEIRRVKFLNIRVETGNWRRKVITQNLYLDINTTENIDLYKLLSDSLLVLMKIDFELYELLTVRTSWSLN